MRLWRRTGVQPRDGRGLMPLGGDLACIRNDRNANKEDDQPESGEYLHGGPPSCDCTPLRFRPILKAGVLWHYKKEPR